MYSVERGFSAPFVSKGDGYNPGIDYLKFAAALVIALFHGNLAPNWLAEAGVTLFVGVLVIFTMRKLEKPRDDPMRVAVDRARRLLGVWLIWSAIYATLIVGGALMADEAMTDDLLGWLPPRGSQGQLWFLPYAAILTMGLGALARHGPSAIDAIGDQPAFGIAALGAASMLALHLWTVLPLGFGLPALYAPSALLGLLMFSARGEVGRIIAIAGASMTLGLALAALGFQGTAQLWLGAPILAVALVLRLPASPLAPILGRMSMSIYLVHLLAIAVVWKLPGVRPDGIVGGAILIGLSLAGAAALLDRRLARLVT